jgi:hypothetical protein
MFRCDQDARLNVVGPYVDFGGYERRAVTPLMLPRGWFSLSLRVGQKEGGPSCHLLCGYFSVAGECLGARCGYFSVAWHHVAERGELPLNSAGLAFVGSSVAPESEKAVLFSQSPPLLFSLPIPSPLLQPNPLVAARRRTS